MIVWCVSAVCWLSSRRDSENAHKNALSLSCLHEIPIHENTKRWRESTWNQQKRVKQTNKRFCLLSKCLCISTSTSNTACRFSTFPHTIAPKQKKIVQSLCCLRFPFFGWSDEKSWTESGKRIFPLNSFHQQSTNNNNNINKSKAMPADNQRHIT